MKPLYPAASLYLVRRESLPEFTGKTVLTRVQEDRSHHLYLGQIVEVGPATICTDPDKSEVPLYKKGDYILYVAACGWKLQNCPHKELLEIDKDDLVFLKEEDVVCLVGFKK